MKKLSVLSVLFVLLAVGANAQTEQGRWVVSGKTGLDFLSNSEQAYYDGEKDGDRFKSSKLSFNAAVGYFVIDNLAVALGAGISTEKQGKSDPKTIMAVGPQVTYYFPLDGQVKPFLTAGGGFTTESYANKDESKFSGPFFGGGAGVAIFLHDNISLDLGANYINTNVKNKADKKEVYKTGTIGASVGFSLFF